MKFKNIKKEYQQRPLASFLSSILNFNSLIPANKDASDDKNVKTKKIKVNL